MAGVTNVVKLDQVSEGDDNGAVSQGMVVHYLPIDFDDQLIGPVKWQQVTNATDFITPGTYVHCLHGQDRTGLIVAVYHVRHDGWTKARAEKEMLAHGFHKELHGLWDFWEDEVK